jgi:hypothetical protein
MAWFLRAIEDVDGRWQCRHGQRTFDSHDQLGAALAHLRLISAEMGSVEMFVHYGDGGVDRLGSG